MPTIVLILGVLFIVLFIMVALVERFGKRQSNEEVSRFPRWIIPLMALLMLMQLIAYYVL